MRADAAAGRSSPSRRRFLRGLGASVGIAAASGALGSCSGPGQAPAPAPAAIPDRSATERVVRFANWPDYIDKSPADPRRHPTLQEFTRQTGIRVAYSEPVASNEQFAAQLGLSLALGQDPGFDVVVLSDWMVAQFIELGWAHPLSAARLPNARRRLLPPLRDRPLPDVLAHSVPWQGSFTGIAWNANATRGRPVRGMSDLLTAPELHGRVGLVAEMRDVVGLTLLDMGHDPARVTDDQFNAALGMLDRAVRSGQIREVSDFYYQDLISGKIAASVSWPGDITFFQPEHPELHFILPAAGWMLYTDNLMIPAFARHRENAERLMDFYYQPPIAAELAIFEQYLCPVNGARQVVRATDAVLAGDPYAFPPDALLDRSHCFRLLTSARSQDYTSRYGAIVGQ
jgi:spermidine/putrescine transport system substrate-binding protein